MKTSPFLLILVLTMLVVGCHADRRADVVGPEYEACTEGDVDACFRHGTSREVGTVSQRRSALVAYQYACLLDHGPSCGRLAQLFGDDAVAPGRAMDNLRKGCDGGDVDSCMELAERLPERSAFKLYQRACKSGEMEGCEAEATFLRRRFRVGDNLQRAQDLSERACEGGWTPACISAGQALLFGSGVPRDSERGLELLERACTEETGEGCIVLARVWQDGLGVEADPSKAETYYSIAERHVSEPMAKDPTSAFVVYVDACNFGDLLGCFNAAWFLAEGAEVRRNVSTSRELFERACDGGVARACERWKSIQPRRSVERGRIR